MARTRNGCLGAGYSSRHTQAPRSLSAAFGPGPFPTLLRGHAPAVGGEFPGLRGYRYSFDVAAAQGESPYYCVFEADFHDAAALSAARESPEGQAVSADVPNYATGGVVVLNYELHTG
jgi:uncharacterized protein (TIGR02118 family)